jgi:hypothetical protein
MKAERIGSPKEPRERANRGEPMYELIVTGLAILATGTYALRQIVADLRTAKYYSERGRMLTQIAKIARADLATIDRYSTGV